ncbi:MAG: hypothetical protein ABIO70_24550 [Pseudomonadota bacterium]
MTISLRPPGTLARARRRLLELAAGLTQRRTRRSLFVDVAPLGELGLAGGGAPRCA